MKRRNVVHPNRKKLRLDFTKDQTVDDPNTMEPMNIEESNVKTARDTSRTPRDGTLNYYGKKIMDAFVKLKQGEPTSAKERLSISRTLGRTKEQARGLVRSAKRRQNISPSEKTFTSFLSLNSVSITSATYRFGCGRSCINDYGAHTLVCPCCRKFIYHRECLMQRCRRLNLKLPKEDSEAWACPNCQLKDKLRHCD